jgi:DNA invertase Pin-like site-specific DNA recombinase
VKSRSAGIYVRISRDPEGREAGVQRQEEDCRSLAEARGWEVAEVYSDNDLSAYSGKPRPGWDRLLADLEAHRIDAVVAYSASRMYRRLADLQRLIDLSNGNGGVEIATVVSGKVDLSTADGRMLAGILASVDQGEVERTQERIKRAMRSKRERGEHSGGGRRAFGYNPDMTIRPAEAALLQEAARRVLSGESVYRVARTMGAWSTPQALARSLRAPRQAGLFPDGSKGSWEPIIDAKTRRLLLARLANPPAGHPNALHFALSGLVHCGLCGAPLYGSGSSYRCVGAAGGCAKIAVARVPLERYLFGLIDAEAITVTGPGGEVPQGLLDQLEDIDRRIAQLGLDYASGDLNAAQVRAATDSLEGQKRALQAQVDAAMPSRPTIHDDFREGFTLADILAKMPEAAAANLEAIRGAFQWYFERVEVLPGQRGRHGLDPARVRVKLRG